MPARSTRVSSLSTCIPTDPSRPRKRSTPRRAEASAPKTGRTRAMSIGSVRYHLRARPRRDDREVRNGPEGWTAYRSLRRRQDDARPLDTSDARRTPWSRSSSPSIPRSGRNRPGGRTRRSLRSRQLTRVGPVLPRWAWRRRQRPSLPTARARGHGLKATYFIDPLFSYALGMEPLRDVVAMIAERGQESGLTCTRSG